MVFKGETLTMEKIMNHLMRNPQEAYAVANGQAMPIGLNVKELLNVIQFFSNKEEDKKSEPVRGYWT